MRLDNLMDIEIKGLNVMRNLLLIALSFLVPVSVFAAPGIQTDVGRIHFNEGLTLESRDLEVKGRYSTLRFSREYRNSVDARWVWNERWQPLVIRESEDGALSLLRGQDTFQGGSGQTGSRFTWASQAGRRGGCDYVQGKWTCTFVDTGRFVRGGMPVITREEGGYRWESPKGDWITYNAQGLVTAYGYFSEVRARLEHDARQRIVRVNDANGNLMLRIGYTGTDSIAPAYAEDYTGRRVSYHYDDLGQLVQVTDVRGKVWRYRYDNQGRISAQVNPRNAEVLYDYDIDNVTQYRITDKDGLSIDYNVAEDPADDGVVVIYERHPDGSVRETKYGRNSANTSRELPGQPGVRLPLQQFRRINNELLEERYGSTVGKDITELYSLTVQPDGTWSASEADLQGRLVRRWFSDGSEERWTYRPNVHQPETHTNRNGVVTRTEYDSQNRIRRRTEAVGTSAQRATDYSYPNNQTRIITHSGPGAPDVIREERLDAFGNVIERIDPEQHATHYTYNVMGQVLTETLPEGGVYRYEYDEAGNLLRREDPIGRVTEFRYDDVGNRVWQKLPNEGEFHFEYNAMNERIATVNPLGHRSTVAFDRQTREEVRTDEEGNVTRLRKNPMGLPELSVDGGGNTTRMNWKGFQLESVNYPTFSQEFEYRHGTLSAQKDVWEGGERRNRFVQSPLGELLEQHDALNNPTRNRYDELGRLMQITDAEGGVIRLDYDHRDNLLQVTDPENRVTRFEYDRLGQVTAEIRTPEPGQENRRRYSYDRNGNLKEENTPNGERRIHHYDLANQLTSMESYASGASVPERTTVLAYNALGQISGYSDGQTEGFYEYDVNGQVIELITDFGPFSKTQAYTYYRNGLKKTYTNAEGITYTYTYNGNNQLTGIHIPGHGQLSYSNYQWLVPQSQQLPGGAEISLSYDGLLQLQERRLRDPASNELASAAYEFDLVSNIRRINTEHGEYQFDYDTLYRLTKAEYPTGTAANDEDFGYDGVGNRVRHTRAIGSDTEPETVTTNYNDANQLVATDAGAVFTYNANGHTATKTQNGQVTEYRYNSSERLVAVEMDGQVAGQYAYNPFGQRVRKTANGQTTWYLYNEEGLAAEYDTNGNLIKEYHFKPYRPWMAEPLFQRTASSEIYYYQNDHMGTPKRMLSQDGAVVWEAHYSGYGMVSINVNLVENNLRFPGQYYDAENGFYHNYFRDYGPSLGRYIQGDPVGLMGGINIYLYAGGNPLINFDAFGLSPERCGFDWSECRNNCLRIRYGKGGGGLYDAAWSTITPSVTSIVSGEAASHAIDKLDSSANRARYASGREVGPATTDMSGHTRANRFKMASRAVRGFTFFGAVSASFSAGFVAGANAYCLTECAME